MDLQVMYSWAPCHKTVYILNYQVLLHSYHHKAKLMLYHPRKLRPPCSHSFWYKSLHFYRSDYQTTFLTTIPLPNPKRRLVVSQPKIACINNRCSPSLALLYAPYLFSFGCLCILRRHENIVCIDVRMKQKKQANLCHYPPR